MPKNLPSSKSLFKQMRDLRYRMQAIESEISDLEATVSQVITSQEDKIYGLESAVHPYSRCGEAACNWRDET